MNEQNKIVKPDYRSADIEIAHEAAAAMDPLMTESKKTWDSYYEGISESDLMADLVEDYPAAASKKAKAANKIGEEILSRRMDKLS